MHLTRSKSNSFTAGKTIYLGTTGDNLCPVGAMLRYLVLRPSTPGPLFLLGNGSNVSRATFIQSLHQALNAAGVDCSGFIRHKFPHWCKSHCSKGFEQYRHLNVGTLEVTCICIKKYGTTSYLRIANVLKWPPIRKI